MECFMLEQQKIKFGKNVKTFYPSQVWWSIPINPALRSFSRKTEFKVSLGYVSGTCLIKTSNLNHSSLSHVLLIAFTSCSCWISPVNRSRYLPQGVLHLPNDSIDCSGQNWEGKRQCRKKRLLRGLREGGDTYRKKGGGALSLRNVFSGLSPAPPWCTHSLHNLLGLWFCSQEVPVRS